MTYVDPGLGISDIPLGASTGKKTPIGVPKGYTVTSRVPTPVHGGWVHSMQVEQQPLYFEGDEWGKAPTTLQDVADLQRALVQSGFLDPTGVVYGSYDPKTAAAFKNILAIGNQSGAQWQDALATRLALVDQQGGFKSGRQVPPLTIKLSNPQDLKIAAQNVAKNLMGGNLAPEELDRFVQSYQQMETQAQQQQYGQQYNASGTGYGGGGAVVAPPTTAAAAETQIREAHPTEVKQQGFVDAFEPLRQALTQRVAGGGVQ